MKRYVLFGLGLIAFLAAIVAYTGIGTSNGALAAGMVLACLAVGVLLKTKPDSIIGWIGAFAIIAAVVWVISPPAELREFNADFDRRQRDAQVLEAYMRDNRVPEPVRKEAMAKFYRREATKDEVMQQYFGVARAD
jgi:hypothetical protein